jgi:hypothetical protein
MKKVLLSILLLSASLTTFSQSTLDKSSVFIGLGPSMPIGDFSSKEATDEKAGLAALGFYFDLGYQFKFSKNVGAIGIFKGKTYGISKDALKYALPNGSGGSMSVEASTWKMGSILAGLTQDVSLFKSEFVTLELREAAGVQFTSTPEINVRYNIPGIGSSTNNQQSQSAASFTYLLGLGFRYQLNNHLGLKLYGDFNTSQVKFKDIMVVSGGTTTVVSSSQQTTGTIDVGLGLTIGL